MNEKSNEKVSERFGIVSICFILIFSIILLRLVDLQVIHGKENEEDSRNRQNRKREIIAHRGNIIDRNGLPIAVNRMGYAVKIAWSDMKDDERSDMLLKLIDIFEKNGDKYERNFSGYLTFNPISFGYYINKSQKDIDEWKKFVSINKEKDLTKMPTPEDTFKFLRGRFKIGDKYTDEQAYKIMTIKYDMFVKNYTAIYPIILAKSVKDETVAQLEERHQEFPGIIIDIIPQREYVDAENMAHVLGYIGSIQEEQYKELKDKGYKMDDVIGKTGIEQSMEQHLKGTNGERWVEVDSTGNVTSEIGGKPAVPGNDVVLTIDSRLQKVAIESMKKNIEKIKSQANYKTNFGDARAGAVVAIDVNSGEVLTMASYPTYDPSVFLKSSNDPEAQKTVVQLNKDEKNKPLYNRATQWSYTPGSTFKSITAIAGLETPGGITLESNTIYDKGWTEIGGMKFHCHDYSAYRRPHYNIGLTKAIATSCNVYFQELGLRVGIENIDKWSKLFGLGEPTGIELWETKGIRANKTYKKDKVKEDWWPADTVQASIGQSFNSFTPLQLANYVSTIANGGKRYQPHIVKEIRSYDGSAVKETEPKFDQLPVKKQTIQLVQQGMIEVAQSAEGTAEAAFKGFPGNILVAGKTGTPETGREQFGESSDGLFIAFAPADNPKIAVAVVIERGVWGSNAAHVARDVLDEYFGLNKSTLPKDGIILDEVKFTR